MKKVIRIGAILLILVNTFALSSCGEHVHEFDEGNIIKNATCIEEGIKEYKCIECGEVKKEQIEKTEHSIVVDSMVNATCIATGLTEGSHCSICNEVIKAQEKINLINHEYIKGICTMCNKIDPDYISEGLEFKVSDDNKYFVLTGIGTCNDEYISIPSKYKGLPVIEIEYGAFYECVNIKRVRIPSQITIIDDSAFYNCSKLEEIYLDEGSQITTIGKSTFYNCKKLISITIPEGVMSLKEAVFSGCGSLTTVVFEENSALYTIQDRVFEECRNLQNIEIPNSVTSIGNRAFFNCRNLTTITIPKKVVGIGIEAFSDCVSLKEVIFEEGSKLTSICQSTFKGCQKLKKIIIPSGVKEIDKLAFFMCSSLEEVIFEEDSQLNIINTQAFQGCTSLENISLPNTLTNIGNSAFNSCSSLTKIILSKNIKNIGKGVFNRCTNLTIYCEIESAIDSWNKDWNESNCPVVWNYNE